MTLYFLAFVLVYVLSLGPVLWACKWKPVSRWTALPAVVQVAYQPAKTLMNIVPGPLRPPINSYFVWWLEHE